MPKVNSSSCAAGTRWFRIPTWSARSARMGSAVKNISRATRGPTRLRKWRMPLQLYGTPSLAGVMANDAVSLPMARRIAENSPLAVGVIKEQLRILARSHPVSPDTFERIQALRRAVYESADYVEGKRAFLEKRRPVFTGDAVEFSTISTPIAEPVGS